MKLDPRNPACILAATLLAIAFSGCGQEPPPKPVVKSVPVPVAPVNQDAEKAEAAKAEAAKQGRPRCGRQGAGRPGQGRPWRRTDPERARHRCRRQ